MQTAFLGPPPVTVPIQGTDALFPVHRIYCVGRNYAAHAREMGSDPTREPPFFFSKPADAVVTGGKAVSYPPRTANLHHEVELVVALSGGGANLSPDEAMQCVYGYAVGIDLTRRDLQAEAKADGRPWDTAKGFDQSAPIGDIHPAADFEIGTESKIELEVNGALRQEAVIGDLIWSIPELLAELSTLFRLQPGDLVFTGTPAGVGAIEPGDHLVARVSGLEPLEVTVIA